MLLLNAPTEYLLLPDGGNEKRKKHTKATADMQNRQAKYLEGLRMYKTQKEAMTYAGIKRRCNLKYWRELDPDFARAEKAAQEENLEDVCDMAIKGLFMNIAKGDMTAIKYLLDRRHPDFMPRGKIEVSDITELEKYREELKNLTIYVQAQAGDIA